jgi:hypothetical protein
MADLSRLTNAEIEVLDRALEQWIRYCERQIAKNKNRAEVEWHLYVATEIRNMLV